MITWKHWCWTGIAVAHLLIAALHAAHLEEWTGHQQPLIKGLATYGDYTGAGNIFSFFAPAVGNEIAVIYTLAASDSSQRVVRLEGNNTECNRRIQTIYNFFSIEEACPLLAQSCASYMLRRYPGHHVVRVTAVARHVPGMQEYRGGARPEWSPFLVKDYYKR
ncbi:hypothetical protein [uncultured Chitinophaga sp.]|uniref:hypothetical protein n=1 Tax=uncultured Chitinophaga sp. TaxID=339340 RepID=UPI00261875C6|nr:hypothetical protein [uncultured Chitinophaga sp.]